MPEIKKTVCSLDCPDACGILAHVEKGRIVKLEGDPEHPFTRGFLCRKVRHFHHRIQSERRLLYPQKRVGKKGEGKFERIGWDEAWKILTEKLREIEKDHGPEALLPYSYAGNMGIINRMAGYPFFHRFGASQLDMTICSAAASAAWKAHLGATPGSNPEAASKADLILLWGINVKTTNIHFWPIVQKARKQGAKLVVIDPYKNATAKAADHYFQVFPGGDSALALGVLKCLMEKNALDDDFIEHQTEGFEALKDSVEKTTMDELARDAGLGVEEIETLAELIAQRPKTFVRIGIGMTRNRRGAMSVRAILSLAAAKGLFVRQEGKGVLLSSGAFQGNADKLSYRSLMKNSTRKINMIRLGEALTRADPPIKGLFVYNSNPVSVAPDTNSVKTGLMREDLFLVVHDLLQTPTADYADLLLPASSSFENEDLFTGYGHDMITYVDPVIPPLGEAVSNFDLFQELAKKLGYEDQVFKQTTAERALDYLSDLKGLPDEAHDLAILKNSYVHSTLFKNGDFGFGNQQGRFRFQVSELGPDSPQTACVLRSGEFMDPDLKSRFPYRLITPPHHDLLNSTFGEDYIGTKGEVMIHPLDADKINIKNGQPVRLYNHRGDCVRTARVTEDTRCGLLVAVGGFWEDEKAGVQPINNLTSQNETDLGGGSTFHESLVDVETLEEIKS